LTPVHRSSYAIRTMVLTREQLDWEIEKAVSYFWRSRLRQAKSQKKRGKTDRGARSAVTGGAQMGGFVRLIADLVSKAGVPKATIYRDKKLELPGFFRPTKQWDLLVVIDGTVLAIIEAKSQVGPSFGNNFNNRTEEAIGSAVDLWTAYREGAFGGSPRPWLGYLFLLEDCLKSRTPVKVMEPHFDVRQEFKEASYMLRYELLCRKLVRERHYEAAAFMASPRPTNGEVSFSQPASDLAFSGFAASPGAHVSAFASIRGN